ncbi:MAG TPA: hypothetical protein VNY35_06650 [Solirubrobacteraceae bacterium]|jgi:hypothetical protein|nr:hypothetical protein [Solirubrobacteraceae bacterium]
MSTVAAPGPSDLYRDRRKRGDAHDEATRQVCHMYGRSPQEMAPILERARADFENPAPEIIEPEQEVAEVLPPSQFDTAETELRAKLVALNERRQELSLDAIGDEASTKDLSTVERDLEAGERELVRIDLARREDDRRQRQAREHAEAERVQDALDRAAGLAGDRERAEAKLTKAAAELARSIAAVHDVAAKQAAALSEAGRDDAWRQTMPSPLPIVAQALLERGLPTDWLTPFT